MQLVIISIHLIIALAMVGIILIQRSEGGSLSGLGGGTGSFLTTRGTATLLTHTTAILAGLFMATSLLLTILAERSVHAPSILEETSLKKDANLPQISEEKLAPPLPQSTPINQETHEKP